MFWLAAEFEVQTGLVKFLKRVFQTASFQISLSIFIGTKRGIDQRCIQELKSDGDILWLELFWIVADAFVGIDMHAFEAFVL